MSSNRGTNIFFGVLRDVYFADNASSVLEVEIAALLWMHVVVCCLRTLLGLLGCRVFFTLLPGL